MFTGRFAEDDFFANEEEIEPRRAATMGAMRRWVNAESQVLARAKARGSVQWLRRNSGHVATDAAEGGERKNSRRKPAATERSMQRPALRMAVMMPMRKGRRSA